jgi:hypothetical protein
MKHIRLQHQHLQQDAHMAGSKRCAGLGKSGSSASTCSSTSALAAQADARVQLLCLTLSGMPFHCCQIQLSGGHKVTNISQTMLFRKLKTAEQHKKTYLAESLCLPRERVDDGCQVQLK